jgi:polysaccharide pyruvyl transferase WcaK-like protein
MKKLKVGILGLALRSPKSVGGNLGCYALGYSFFEIINSIAKQNGIKIQIVQIKSLKWKGWCKQIIKRLLFRKDIIANYYSELYQNLEFCKGDVLKLMGRRLLMPTVTKCNFIFDFTAGDSFTDIYGEDRFYERTGLKKKIIESGIPLILGSQTIGPFNADAVEKYAVEVIEKCKAVFVRDNQSKEYVEKISRTKPILTTDVAFFLPYEKGEKADTMKKIGFNPSGLLWMGGYNGKNQFGLTVDYQEYCREIVKSLLEQGYEVYLILHAYFKTNRKGYYHADNDKLAVDALHEIFPSTKVTPYFATPMEAKSCISGMDLFIGARMHATIAAISSGVPVIPFSYSRKFEGLFSSLNYPFVVEGTKWKTQKAIDSTLEWIKNIEILKEHVTSSNTIIQLKKRFLFNEYEKIILNKK